MHLSWRDNRSSTAPRPSATTRRNFCAADTRLVREVGQRAASSGGPVRGRDRGGRQSAGRPTHEHGDRTGSSPWPTGSQGGQTCSPSRRRGDPGVGTGKRSRDLQPGPHPRCRRRGLRRRLGRHQTQHDDDHRRGQRAGHGRPSAWSSCRARMHGMSCAITTLGCDVVPRAADTDRGRSVLVVALGQELLHLVAELFGRGHRPGHTAHQ